jgi:outer membrane protein assembly factor BamC
MNPTHLLAAATAALLVLSGCSGKVIEGKKIDYKSAGKGKALEVPSDLAAPPTSDRYSVPEASSGSATFSEYSENQAAKPGEPSTAVVLPVREEQLRIERGGSQRWLVSRSTPEQLWPAIREFWQDSGFLIDRDAPELGIMETDWAENRAKIPDSAIRKLFGKVLDQAYSYPERDKFRTRLERAADGATEIYISHRGAYQVVVGERSNEQVKWQMRPTDPELEAEMLSRLMARLGAQPAQVEAQKKPEAADVRAEITKNGETPESLLLRDSFDRAWRRVGLALDRVGFTVEDRDRSKGLYYVRYVDPDSVDEKSESFLSKLAFWRSSDAAKKQEQYRISVANVDRGSEVRVLNVEGEKATTASAGRILSLLQAELK